MPGGMNMGDVLALKPCPFCGSREVSMSYWAGPHSPEPRGRFVECEECGAAGPGVAINDPHANPSAEDSASERWNTRAALAKARGKQ